MSTEPHISLPGKAPSEFDSVTLNHWLWFKYQCHECSPSEFQRLFENIITRRGPEFMRIRPYGNIGDRKCDGLYFSDGTIFQVYSPDELTQAEVLRKINEDLAVAVKHWGDGLRKWVFVYNARRGLPPDIPRLLQQKQSQYPAVVIESLSNDALWEIARHLSIQQRAEILGAPAGYDHLFLVPSSAPQAVSNSLQNGWFLLVHQVNAPINMESAVEALKPGQAFGAPVVIQPHVGPLPWEEAAAYQKTLLDEVLQQGRSLLPRYAVFSLSPISLAVHLGFTLSDRVEVQCFQYDRDTNTWNWPDDKVQSDSRMDASGMPTELIGGQCSAVIRVSLSARIRREDTEAAVNGASIEIDLAVPRPSVMWLRSQEQLIKLRQTFHEVLEAIRTQAPHCSRIHLFYAGPTGGAIVIGQQINPRMNPPVDIYEYSYQENPKYRRALTLED